MKPSLMLMLLLFSASWSGAFCQNLEQLAFEVTKTVDPDKKLAAIDSVLSHSFRKDDAIFMDYSEQFITLARQQGKYTALAKKAINLQGTYSYNHKAIEAIKLINIALAYKSKIKDSFLIGSLYYRRGRANMTIDLQRSLQDYDLALRNLKINDTVHRADVYLYKGHANTDVGDFEQATKDYNTAYVLYEAIQDYPYMLYAQTGNINMYSMNGFFNEANKERDKYIDKALTLGIKDNLASAYYNQSIDYKKQGLDSLERESLTKALVYSKYTQGNEFEVYINARFCENYCRAGNIKKAKQYLDAMETVAVDIVNNALLAMVYYGAKATYYKATGQFTKAVEAALTKSNIANKLGHGEELVDAHLLLSQIYEAQGDYKNALTYKNQYITLKDKRYNESNGKTLAYFQSKYQSEKNEREIVEKNAKLELLEAKQIATVRQSLFIGFVTLLLFSVVLLYRIQRNQRHNKKMQERFSQDLLVSQEAERKRISKDLHDGLGQRLLVLKNKLLNSADNESLILVDNTIDEVRAITRDLYPFHLQELGITKAIEHTISQLDDNSSVFISAEIENIDHLFNKEQEVNIYRIVQESLSNIVKHAKAEATKVLVQKNLHSVYISIRDNGKGFDFQEKYNKNHTLGLKTLLERTKSLNGQMKVQSKKEKGTLIEFQFPILI